MVHRALHRSLELTGDPSRSHAAVAERLGVPRATYHRWVTSGSPAALGKLLEAATAFGLSVYLAEDGLQRLERVA